MNRILRNKCNNYTIISNTFVRDGRLSLKAKGMMATVMSLVDFLIGQMYEQLQ